ncbi:O-methyltransferase [Candidatus Korobacter versatilis]|nr:class I SAM-dependent methyltransferase [Candidatus Koribacter versatilis]
MDDLRYITEPKVLKHLLEQTRELNFSMASEPLVGSLLRSLAASKPGGRLLELGTGTGISAAWILDGMSDDATLVSVDNDAAVQDVARRALGNDRRLTVVTQDGTAFLKKQTAASFDFVFADAMPGKYEGTELALSLVKPGGIFVIDDMLPQPNWPEGHAAKVPVLIDLVAKDKRFETTPISWASGVVVAVRKLE